MYMYTIVYSTLHMAGIIIIILLYTCIYMFVHPYVCVFFGLKLRHIVLRKCIWHGSKYYRAFLK